jgi:hypothetical protein
VTFKSKIKDLAIAYHYYVTATQAVPADDNDAWVWGDKLARLQNELGVEVVPGEQLRTHIRVLDKRLKSVEAQIPLALNDNLS